MAGELDTDSKQLKQTSYLIAGQPTFLQKRNELIKEEIEFLNNLKVGRPRKTSEKFTDLKLLEAELRSLLKLCYMCWLGN